MEEIINVKQEKSSKKQFVISLMVSLAIISFLLGILDIKSNAAESNTIKLTITREQENFNTGALNYYPDRYTLTSESEIEMYVYQSHFERTSEPINAHFFAVSDSPITTTRGSSSYTCTSFTQNGKTRYYIHHGQNYPNTVTWPHFYRLTFETEVNYKSLTTSYYHNETDFINDYINDNLGFVIDYNSFEIDYDMPTIQNVRTNRIKNWVSSGLYNQYFDYITWDVNNQYDVQIQKVFSVYFSRKVDGETRFLGAEYNQDTIQNEVFEKGTNSLTQQTDMQYISDERSNDFQFYSDVRKTTNISNWEKSDMCFCYMVRYVDLDNEKAGAWCYILPFENVGDYDQKFTCSYQLEDGTTTENFIPSGTNENYTDFDEVGGVDNVKDIIDAENQFKEEYEIVDGDVDVQEATNWLYSVVNFIKGTPQVVGSVLGFLPQPILYGMYVCIFLGIIASGIAIVKALF